MGTWIKKEKSLCKPTPACQSHPSSLPLSLLAYSLGSHYVWFNLPRDEEPSSLKIEKPRYAWKSTQMWELGQKVEKKKSCHHLVITRLGIPDKQNYSIELYYERFIRIACHGSFEQMVIECEPLVKKVLGYRKVVSNSTLLYSGIDWHCYLDHLPTFPVFSFDRDYVVCGRSIENYLS